MSDKRSYHEALGEPCALCGRSADKHRKHSGSNRTRAQRTYWVGLDGEGMGRKPHRYVLMAYSDITGKHSDSLYDANGLSTQDCLEFLLSLPVDARIAGYYLGYDWTMILRDMPNRNIYRLLRPELRYRGSDEGNNFTPVLWKRYKLNYCGKMMRIAKKGGRSVTIWDVGNFFQSPFVDAINKWDVGSKVDNAMIADMKAQRSAFAKRDAKRIEHYCMTECRLLAELIGKLDNAHTEAGLKLHSYHGPGSTATVALNIMRISEKRGRIHDDMVRPVRQAFFGGRFEQALNGIVEGPVYGYDIVSAYPYQALNLPCLEHGVWENVKTFAELRNARHALIQFRLHDCGVSAWAPLPIRLSNGCIVFPQAGATGYIWLHEYNAALRGWSGIQFLQAWALRSDCNCQPFARVLDWFRAREALGKDAKGHTFRLGLNSIYGKLAQSVGRPRFRSLVWAGMITSGCRAQLLELMLQHSRLENVLAVATDGLYSKEVINVSQWPLPPDRLGSWEKKTHGSTTFVRPGIYWTAEDMVKARGLGKKTLAQHRAALYDAITSGVRIARLGEVEVFGGARQCVYEHNGRHLRSDRYGEWCKSPVRVDLSPMPKRMPDWGLWTLPGVESAPYSPTVISPQRAELQRRSDAQWAMGA